MAVPRTEAAESTRIDRFETRVTRLFGIRYPIVQGGLARIARAELAAAVSNAGGLGQIAMAGIGTTPESMRAEIRKAKSLTRASFAVNFPIGHLSIEALLDVVMEEGVPAVSLTRGNPRPAIAHLAGSGIRILVLVSGPEQAKKAEQAGAHAVATVGYEGGGHLGRNDLTTFVGVPLVADAVRIPAIAGGGVADGRGLAAALALGAEGVEIGTRFITVQEAHAHENYKRALLRATNTTIVKRRLDQPGRALANRWTDDYLKAEADGTPRADLLEMVGAKANERGVFFGDVDNSLLWAGQAAALIEDIPTAKELIDRMVLETRSRMRVVDAMTRLR
ncbi:MAG: nitronate monooxygenase [Burkholderiaceae bacterium]|nr:nitronate monooxygenase [Burkholderiaceae bacterium]